MKTIIKLLFAAILLTATFQASRAAIQHYTFVDALQESLLFSGNRNDDQVADQVLKIAGDHEVPLAAEDISVRREPFQLKVDAPYTTDIDLLPGIYKRKWQFDASVSVRLLNDSRPSTPRR